ncbi:YdaU family protein [Bartonella sp. CB169]|uniref:YdaU family protein n=1 Tax=Bartonella sp. CB169 TaxID=3112257 RepID=UPI00300E3575
MKHTNQQENPHYELSRLPYVCWYQNDFLGGVRGMRAHEIGIYTILLNEMYARGRPLELSEERLARLCGCDKRTFVNVLEMLIQERKILHLASGLWNKRCENVFQDRKKLLEQKSFAGRSSAKKRKKINDKIQQLLNESVRDDEQNLEAQKKEEKETPNGVSEKNFFLIDQKREQEVKSSNLYSPHIANEQNGTEHLSDASANTENPSGLMANVENPVSLSAKTKNASGSGKKTKGRTAIPEGRPLPADWQADIHAAISEGLSEEQARWQEKKFRDYWHAKSGKEALKADWQATWRNWFRHEIERVKESRERLAVFSPHPTLTSHCSDNDYLYRSLINYHTN